MQDLVTLDQLRVLVTVADEGSFSAAARKLNRVQSAVSAAMSNLERQLDVRVWDRTTKIPGLTEAGAALLAGARRLLSEADELWRLAGGLRQGLEPRVSLCVDFLFPLSALVELCREFAVEFPTVELRVDTQTLSAVSARVLDGSATLGVVSPLGVVPRLQSRALAAVRMIPVVAKGHPLAQIDGKIPTGRLAEFVQIVLFERHAAEVPDQAVLSPRTWRVADLHTKHALLREGLGWGNLPEHLVTRDLARGSLVRIYPAAWGEEEHTLYLSAVFRADAAFGPAHRWLLVHLERLCRLHAPGGRQPSAAAPRPKRRKQNSR